MRACRVFGRKKLLLICLIGGLFLFGLWRKFMLHMEPMSLYLQEPTTIVWWTMKTDYKSVRICDTHICQFSADRRKLPNARAVIFYASEMELDDVPLPRLSHHSWALLHEESPRNVPYIRNEVVLQHFNFTSTFSRHSDLPLTTQYLPSLELLTSAKYIVPVGQKSLYRSSEALAPIAFLQSDCDTMNGRDEYVRQLMQHIAVDSYGHCLHNRDLPKSLREDYLNQLYAPELLHLLSKYKFIIAYENGVCDDYITEKFWRPLIVGAVPIYYGSPSVRDWQPNALSVVHIDAFDNPKALANFIAALDRNDSAYNAYLNHKYDQVQPISNERLLNEFKIREFPKADDDNMFGAFECHICRQLHNQQPRQQQQQFATHKHYNCPLPVPYPNMDHTQISKEWQAIMETGKCQAYVLDTLWQRNMNYTPKEFNAALSHAYQKNLCK